MFAEKIRYGFAGLNHVFHKMRPADGKIGIVLHGLAYFGIGTANGDIFKRTAEAARSVPFKMRQHNHAVVSGQAFADVHFFKMLAAAHRQQLQWCRFLVFPFRRAVFCRGCTGIFRVQSA